MFLDADELADLQSDLEATFNDTCDVLRGTRQADGGGGWTDAPSVIASNLAYTREEMRNPQQADAGGVTLSETLYRFLLPASADVRKGDQLSCSGTLYNVIEMGDFSKAACLPAYCVRAR